MSLEKFLLLELPYNIGIMYSWLVFLVNAIRVKCLIKKSLGALSRQTLTQHVTLTVTLILTVTLT